MNFEVISNNYIYLTLYLIICIFSYSFIILIINIILKKIVFKSILSDKYKRKIFLIGFIFFTILLISFWKASYFIIPTITIFLTFSLAIFYWKQSDKEKSISINNTLVFCNKIHPCSNEINLVLDKYIDSTNEQELYDANSIRNILSKYSNSSLRLLRDELSSETNEYRNIQESVVYLILGIFIGRIFETSSKSNLFYDFILYILLFMLFNYIAISFYSNSIIETPLKKKIKILKIYLDYI